MGIDGAGAKKFRLSQMGSLLIILAAVVFFWDTMFIYPLKILTIFFHELSHGLAGLLTGGSIAEISLVKDEGGLCVTSGGNRFLILSSGYLGSLLWGGAILVLSTRTRYDRAISALIGAILVLISLLWVRPFESFGFVFGVVTGLCMAGIAAYLPASVNDYLLKVIGLTSCLYAVLDLKDDVLLRPGERSDARMLAELTGLPTLFWGVLWMAIAGAATLFFLVLVSRAREADAGALAIRGPSGSLRR